MKENEVGGTCGILWERRGKCTGFWWESQEVGEHLEHQGIDGRIGYDWILGRLAGGV
jgi:hypothetical protein